MSFSPAISKKSRKSIMEKLRDSKLLQETQSTLSEIAKELNPKLQGWINYYGRYCKGKLDQLLAMFDIRIARWARKKYKKLHGSLLMALDWVQRVRKATPHLFAHWRKPDKGSRIIRAV